MLMRTLHTTLELRTLTGAGVETVKGVLYNRNYTGACTEKRAPHTFCATQVLGMVEEGANTQKDTAFSFNSDQGAEDARRLVKEGADTQKDTAFDTVSLIKDQSMPGSLSLHSVQSAATLVP